MATKKKVTIKNPKKAAPKAADAWVKSRVGTKRFTIDIPASLHAKLKIASAKSGQTMGAIMIESLEEKLK